MTPEQFFNQIEEMKRAQEATLAEAAVAETAEQQADEVAIRLAAAQIMPQFLVDTLTFDWREVEGYEQCADLQHEAISGIRIWFQWYQSPRETSSTPHFREWVAGKTWDSKLKKHHRPFQFLFKRNDGQSIWIEGGSEDFAEVWLLAVAEKEKQQATLPSMPVYPDKMLIQAAEQMDSISNCYRVQLTAEQAVAFLETADPHCECWSSNMADFARAINRAVPLMQFGEGNPNNGQSHHVFLVGREYSRVIYLEIAKAYLEIAKAYLRNMEGRFEDYAAFIQQLQDIGREHHAYEIDIQRNDDSAIIIRYWWKRCEICE